MSRRGCVILVWGLALVGSARGGWAHCDTLAGPVVRDARAALAAGDVTPALKWVQAVDEPEIRTAFTRAMAVRGQGDEARSLADQFFFETVVRLHRAGEGAPFTGVKPGGPLEPGVAEADAAIDTGSPDALVQGLRSSVERGVRERLARVVETARRAGESVENGRAFVAAYVDFVHYVERVSAALAASSPAAETEHAAHQH